MTGSILLHVVVPIVAVTSLAAWIAMVFYADAHPPAGAQESTGAQETSEASEETGEIAATKQKPPG